MVFSGRRSTESPARLPRHQLLRCSLAVAAAAVAVALQWLLLRTFGTFPPFPVFFLMATLAAMFLGARCGALYLILSVLAVDFFFIPPRFTFRVWSAVEALSLGVYSASCLVVILLVTQRNQLRQAGLAEAEIKRGKQALLDSEERFRIAQELSLDGFTILKAVRNAQGAVQDFQWQFVNPAAGRILKYAPEELVGKQLLQVLPGNKADSDLFDLYVRVLETGQPHDCELCYEADGIAGWFRNMTVRLGDGVAVCFSDITARKIAEQDLHADLDALTRLHEISCRQLREENFEAVLSEIMEASIAGADKGMLLLADPVSGSLRIAAQHGHQPRFLEFLAAAGLPAALMGDTSGSSQRLVVADVENDQRLEGSRLLQELRAAGARSLLATPITSRNGKLLGILTTQWPSPHIPDEHDLWRIDLLARQTADLVEQKQSQEEREKWAAHLQRSQQLESLGILAGGIAHEFNNLFAAIYGNIELACLDTQSGDISKIAGTLHTAMGTMERARDLTRRLITFSTGGAPIRKTAALAPLLQEAAHIALSGSKVSAAWDIDADLWPCAVDKNQLSQALGNILANAQESMPEGGRVHISATNLPPGTTRPDGVSADRLVLVSIRDEGAGIAKEILDRIFDPFFTTKPKGHGLGLTIAHSIIKKHDGYIEAHSDGTSGATFHIYLPGLPDTAVEAKARTPAPAAKCSILLMDDDQMVRDMASQMLKAIGCTVTCASKGEEAIDLYRKSFAASRPFDLVILDLTVPDGLGGKETLACLLHLDPSVRAIVASGYHDDPVIENPAAYGFLVGLTKPYSLNELQAALQKALDRAGVE